MSATYYRADPGTLNTDPPPWWLANADDEIRALHAALHELAAALEIDGFVGHEECPLPSEPDYAERACDTCKALSLAHSIPPVEVSK